MFKTCLAGLVLVVAATTGEAAAQDEGIRVFGSATLLPVDRSYSHSTHPNDSFLPNAATPGSAGVTELDEEVFFGIGAGYGWRIDRDSLFIADVSWLTGVRDGHQNDNDTRNPAQAAFVYSSAWGVLGAAAVSRSFGAFDAGLEVQAGVLVVDSGWDRFENDEPEDTFTKGLATVGARIGFDVLELSRIEASAFTGTHTGAQLRLVLEWR